MNEMNFQELQQEATPPYDQNPTVIPAPKKSNLIYLYGPVATIVAAIAYAVVFAIVSALTFNNGEPATFSIGSAIVSLIDVFFAVAIYVGGYFLFSLKLEKPLRMFLLPLIFVNYGAGAFVNSISSTVTTFASTLLVNETFENVALYSMVNTIIGFVFVFIKVAVCFVACYFVAKKTIEYYEAHK